MKSLVITHAPADAFDGVGDFSMRLALELGAKNHVLPVLASGSGRALDWPKIWSQRSAADLSEAEALFIQYVPPSYFSHLSSVLFFAWVFFLRFIKGKRIVVTFHEYNVPWAWKPRRMLARIFFDMAALFWGLTAAGLVVTHELNRRKLSRILPWRGREIRIIPIGTPVPDEGYGPRDTQHQKPALVLFGQPGGMVPEILKQLLACAADRHPDWKIFWISKSRSEVMKFLSSVCPPEQAARVEVLERMSNREAADFFKKDLVFLGAFQGGVAGRRSTFIAASAHGLPVAGTSGLCTNPELTAEQALLLSAEDDAAGFTAHVEKLMTSPELRREKGEAMRRLFLKYFSWPGIAASYREYLR